MRTGFKKTPLFNGFFEIKLPFTFKISEVAAAARKSQIWIGLNLLGLLIYSYFFLRYEPGDQGDINTAISLGLTCGPIIVLMILVNAVWLLVNLWKKSRPAVFLWLLAVLLWFGMTSLESLICSHAIEAPFPTIKVRHSGTEFLIAFKQDVPDGEIKRIISGFGTCHHRPGKPKNYYRVKITNGMKVIDAIDSLKNNPAIVWVSDINIQSHLDRTQRNYIPDYDGQDLYQ
jgi:hypothetical protein